MQSLKSTISAKKEILNEIYKTKSIDYKNIHRFYLPDEFLDLYMQAIKKSYGSVKLAQRIALILMVLARHSDKDGVCYPSYKKIMEMTCISNRNQINDALKIMREDLKMFDYIQGNGRSSNLYKLIDIKFWTSVSSIIPKASSIKKQILQYQAVDTRRNSKDLLYKEQNNFLRLSPGPRYKLLCSGITIDTTSNS